jgi:hypothetical protein
VTYQEPYVPINPPEVRTPEERLTPVEFYVDLGAGRPDLEIMRHISDWLAARAPLTLHSIQFSYMPETDMEPPLLVGNMIVGEPIDIG